MAKAQRRVPVQVRQARMRRRYPDMERVRLKDGRLVVKDRRRIPGIAGSVSYTLKRSAWPPGWEDLPLRVNTAPYECAVCGDPAAQRHHWLPRAVARLAGEDPDAWPISYLCIGHHKLWHKWMREAGQAGHLR